MRNGSLWGNIFFEEEVISNSNNKRLQVWLKSFNSLFRASESTQGCVFLSLYSLVTSMTNWVQVFTGLFFYAYVEIHQSRKLVFGSSACKITLSVTRKEVCSTHRTVKSLRANDAWGHTTISLVPSRWAFLAYTSTPFLSVFTRLARSTVTSFGMDGLMTCWAAGTTEQGKQKTIIRTKNNNRVTSKWPGRGWFHKESRISPNLGLVVWDIENLRLVLSKED